MTSTNSQQGRYLFFIILFKKKLGSLHYFHHGAVENSVEVGARVEEIEIYGGGDGGKRTLQGPGADGQRRHPEW